MKRCPKASNCDARQAFDRLRERGEGARRAQPHFRTEGIAVANWARAGPEQSFLVPEAGIEPARCCHRQILSLLRLPISPLRQWTGVVRPKGADYGTRSRRGAGLRDNCRMASRKISYPTVEDVIGNTPLVRLARLPGVQNEQRGNVILGKLEGNNPAGSVKDRPAISMIRRAEERGEIKPGDTLIEATSGNTGIALAMAAATLRRRTP